MVPHPADGFKPRGFPSWGGGRGGRRWNAAPTIFTARRDASRADMVTDSSIRALPVPDDVVEREVAAIPEAKILEPQLLVGHLGLDRERHVGEAPVAHIVLRAHAEDRRQAAREAAVAEGDVADEIHVLGAGDGDMDRRVVGTHDHVGELDVLHAEREDRSLRGRQDPVLAVAGRVDVELVVVRRQVELHAETRVLAHDAGDHHVAHRVVLGPAEADRALVRAQHAVLDRHALAGTRLLHLLLVGADNERVVLRVDDAVAHRHVAAAAEVEAVAVRILRVALDAHAAALHAVAVEEPRAPAAGMVDEDVVQPHVRARHEQHAAPGDERVGLPPELRPAGLLVGNGLVVAVRVAVDRSVAGDGDVRLRDGVEHRALVEARHALHVPVLGMRELWELQRVFAALERGAAVDVQIDVVLEVERIGDVRAAARHEHLSAARCRAGVDRLLDRRRVVRHAVRLRAVRRHVERTRARARRQQDCRRNRNAPACSTGNSTCNHLLHSSFPF